MAIEWKAEGKTALVLTGGGARGAYQVGVLKAVADLFPKRSHNPFSIITGTSAGALNAVAIAASANNFRLSIKKVEKMWTDLSVENVYNADAAHIAWSLLKLFLSLFNSGISNSRPLSLLDNAPLRDLLRHSIQFRNIQSRIDRGYLDAVGITASAYNTGESVTFFQGNTDIKKWRASRKVGVPSVVSIEHLMASSALPTIFPAELIGREYFGDGALRQLSPISPALRMGAERAMVIGVSGNPSPAQGADAPVHSPSLAKIVGHIFNSAFLDALDADLVNLVRINELVGIIENERTSRDATNMRVIDLLCIEPSIEFDKIAEKHLQDLPRTMRAVLHITGANKRGGGGSLASYLLFEGNFCRDLIRHGYEDAMEQESVIRHFFAL